MNSNTMDTVRRIADIYTKENESVKVYSKIQERGESFNGGL